MSARTHVLLLIMLVTAVCASGCGREKTAPTGPPAAASVEHKAEPPRKNSGRAPDRPPVNPRRDAVVIDEPPQPPHKPDDHFLKGFGGYIRDLQKSGIDVVILFDSTGSMGDVVREMETHFREFARVFAYLAPTGRLGFATYRDLKKYDADDYEYTVRYIPLLKCDRDGLNKLEAFVRLTEACGGGDVPDAVLEGVDVAIQKSGWRKASKKVIIVVGDAPPHKEDDGLAKLYAMIEDWHGKTGGIVSCIDTSGASKLMEEFKAMAKAGGGKATFLNDGKDINERLTLLIFGSRWETEVKRVWKHVIAAPADR